MDKHLELWKRAKAVVDKLEAEGHEDETQFVMADFFIHYGDVVQLEDHIAQAEAALDALAG
jgi:hypothetical protein